jgi:uncharacterized protein YbjQ (UPF0145 family)
MVKIFLIVSLALVIAANVKGNVVNDVWTIVTVQVKSLATQAKQQEASLSRLSTTAKELGGHINPSK